MNRETRNKFASGTGPVLTSGNSCWETAPAVFRQLSEDFGPFDIDLTADAQRHLCQIWFGPDSPVGQFDALTALWHLYGRSGYSNPPYGPFVQQMLGAAKHQATTHGFESLLLLPMRVTKAFRAHVLRGASDLIFPDKRLVFFEDGVPRINQKAWLEHGRLVADSALFDSIIVRYTDERLDRPRVSEWKVPPHVTKDDLERARQRLVAPAA